MHLYRVARNLPSKFFLMLLCFFSLKANGQQYVTNGNSVKIPGSNCFRLTSNQNDNSGSVWFSEKIDLKQPFDFEFYLNFGNLDFEGADGIAFIMQTTGNNELGSDGGSLGYSGISPSFGVEFDDFENPENNDPAYDHIALVKNGVAEHPYSASVFNPVSATNSKRNIEDGKDHLIRIKWNPEEFEFVVYFDCKIRIDIIDLDLVNYFFNNESKVWWGFTSSTGGLTNTNVVCMASEVAQKDTLVACENIPIELHAGPSEDGVYDWKPVTRLSNKTIQKPIVRTTKSTSYSVTYNDLCGKERTDTVFVKVNSLPTVTLPKDTFIVGNNSISIHPILNNHIRWKWSTNEYALNQVVATKGWYWLEASNKCGSSRDSIFVDYTDSLHSFPKPVLPPISKTTVVKNTHIVNNSDESLILDSTKFKYNNLIFIVDVSSSMKNEKKLELLKTTLLNLIELLREKDIITIIAYSGDAHVILQPTSCIFKDSITKILRRLVALGSSNGMAALELAFQFGAENFIDGGNNQILIATDGIFSSSEMSAKATIEYVRKQQLNTNVNLSCLAFGNNERAMKFLTNLSEVGNGSFLNVSQAYKADYSLENLIKKQSKK